MSEPDLDRSLRTAEELELLTTGRRSGKIHAVRVWFAYEQGAIWLRTDRSADWFRNLESDPRCRVRVGGLERSARRDAVLDDDAALRALVDLWRAKYGAEWVADWYVERGRVPVRLVLAPER